MNKDSISNQEEIVFKCGAAKSLDSFGGAVEGIAIMLGLLYLGFWTVVGLGDHFEEISVYEYVTIVIRTIIFVIGGCLIQRLFSGLAIMVESSYRNIKKEEKTAEDKTE